MVVVGVARRRIELDPGEVHASARCSVVLTTTSPASGGLCAAVEPPSGALSILGESSGPTPPSMLTHPAVQHTDSEGKFH